MRGLDPGAGNRNDEHPEDSSKPGAWSAWFHAPVDHDARHRQREQRSAPDHAEDLAAVAERFAGVQPEDERVVVGILFAEDLARVGVGNDPPASLLAVWAEEERHGRHVGLELPHHLVEWLRARSCGDRRASLVEPRTELRRHALGRKG